MTQPLLKEFFVTVIVEKYWDCGLGIECFRSADQVIKAPSEYSARWLWRVLHPKDKVINVRPKHKE